MLVSCFLSLFQVLKPQRVWRQSAHRGTTGSTKDAPASINSLLPINDAPASINSLLPINDAPASINSLLPINDAPASINSLLQLTMHWLYVLISSYSIKCLVVFFFTKHLVRLYILGLLHVGLRALKIK